MEHEHRNTNGGYLIVQSSPVVDGVDVQSLSKISRSSSFSSSSSDSLLDGPFGEDDEERRNTKSGNFMMQSSHVVDGVDVQVLSKRSRTSSSSSSSPDSPLDGPFGGDDEEHRNTDQGNWTMQSFPAMDGVAVQACGKISSSYCSSSSSSDTLFNGHYGDENEEHRSTNDVNLMMQSFPTFDGVDVQASNKTSRSSSSSSSSPSPSWNGPVVKDDEEHGDPNDVNLMMQSSLTVDRVDVLASNKTSRSCSSSPSSINSSWNGPFGEDDEEHGQKNDVNFMMQSSPTVRRG